MAGDDIIQKVVIQVDDQSGDALGKLEQSGKQVSESFDKVGKDIGQASQAASQSFGQLGQATSQAGQSAAQMSTAFSQSSSALTQAGSAAAQTAASVAQTGAAAERAAVQMGTVATATTEVNVATAAAGGGLSSLGGLFNNFTSTMSGSRQEMRALSAGAKELGFSIGSLGGVLVRVSKAFGPVGLAVLAVAGIGAALIKTGKDATEAADEMQKASEKMGQSLSATGKEQNFFQQFGQSATQFRETYKTVADEVIGKSKEIQEAVAVSGEKAAASAEKAVEAILKADKALVAQAKARGVAETTGAEQRIAQLDSEQAKADRAATAAVRERDVAIRESMKDTEANAQAVVQALRGIGEGLKDIKLPGDLNTQLQGVKARIDEVVKSGGSFGLTLAQIVRAVPEDLAHKIGEAFKIPESSIDNIRNFKGSLEQLKAAVDQLKPPDLGADKLGGFAAMHKAVEEVRNAWNELISTLGSGNLGSLLAAGIAGFLIGVTQLIHALTGLIQIVNGLIQGFRDLAAVIAGGFGKFVLGMSDEDVAKMKAAISGVGQAAQQAGQQVQQIGQQASVGFKSYDQVLAEGAGKFKTWGDNGLQAGEQAASGINKANTAAQTLQQTLSQLESKGIPIPPQLRDALSGVGPRTTDVNLPMAEIERAAQATVDRVKQIFTINLTESIKPIDFPTLTQGAKEAADAIKAAFAGMDFSKLGGKIDFSELTSDAEKAAGDIKKAFADINIDKIGSKIEFGELIDSARDVAKQIAEEFKNIDVSGTMVNIDWNNVVSEAANAATQVQEVFSNINLSNLQTTIDWGAVTSGAEDAAREVEHAFSRINLHIDQPEIDFSGVIASIQGVVATLNASFAALQLPDFSTMAATIQLLWQAISGGAQAVAEGITSAFSSIDISSGLIGQIESLIGAFNSLAAAADAAASAAARAASASAGGGGGGQRMGGLFRGAPGTDTNLAWLTDYEFIMRPEAVRKYGVAFLDAINSLAFPLGRYGLGGLVVPRMGLPAFAGGGLNRASSNRTLHLTIGGQTFRNLSAPERTAKQLERAAISRQTSATGIRPHWNK